MKTATAPSHLSSPEMFVFEKVTEAMQHAEELGGPDSRAYVELMLAVAAEAQARVSVCVAYAMRALDEARADQVVLARVRGALDTEETGDALVDVARAATAAERRLAAIDEQERISDDELVAIADRITLAQIDELRARFP